jgi:Survival protein SurE
MPIRRLASSGIAAGLALVLVLPGSALAALSASVANLTLPAVTFSHDPQVSSGTMTLTATDTAVVGLGWNVTIQASAFVYSGPNSGTNIGASNFALTSAAAPVLLSGQAIDPTNGPKVPAASPLGTLDVARKVLQANLLYGVGTYTQALGVSLTVPAQARAGTYTTSLTTTISTGP